MAKWLILIVAAYVLYRLFMNDRHKKAVKTEDKIENERSAASEGMVKDPECGAYIEAGSGITARDGETVHSFCSYDCRDAFIRRIQSAREHTELPPERENITKQ